MTVMYSIAERTQLSKRIAQVSKIDTYRSMLKAYGSKRAGRIILDQQQLAESLVYELLGKCTAEKILERTAEHRQPVLQKITGNVTATVKKKFQNLKNTLQSVGTTLKTSWSRLRTLSIQTALTAIAGFVKSTAALVKLQTTRLYQNISRRLSGWRSASTNSEPSTAQENSSESTRS